MGINDLVLDAEFEERFRGEAVRCQYTIIREGSYGCSGSPEDPPVYKCRSCSGTVEGKISNADKKWVEPYKVCPVRSRRAREIEQQNRLEHPTGKERYNEPPAKEMREWNLE